MLKGILTRNNIIHRVDIYNCDNKRHQRITTQDDEFIMMMVVTTIMPKWTRTKNQLVKDVRVKIRHTIPIVREREGD